MHRLIFVAIVTDALMLQQEVAALIVISLKVPDSSHTDIQMLRNCPIEICGSRMSTEPTLP
jgi:hypothetical protein